MIDPNELVTKWDKLGLLDGLTTDVGRMNMAVILETHYNQLLQETRPHCSPINDRPALRLKPLKQPAVKE